MEGTTFAIYPTSFGWVIRCGNDVSLPYETSDAALEVAVADASLLLEQGRQATVTIDHILRKDADFSRPFSNPAAPHDTDALIFGENE